MLLKNLFRILLSVLAVLYVLAESFHLEKYGAMLSTISMVFILLYHHFFSEKRSILFISFLSAFLIGHSISYIGWIVDIKEVEILNFVYFYSNCSFILGYLLLSFSVLRSFNIINVFKKHFIAVVLLLIMNVFCVKIISESIIDSSNNTEFVLEFIYNAVIMLLLTVSLLNSFYRNDGKSMVFTIGTICVVFSEMIQLVYFYIVEYSWLSFVYSSLIVIAFFMFYKATQREYEGPEANYTDALL